MPERMEVEIALRDSLSTGLRQIGREPAKSWVILHDNTYLHGLLINDGCPMGPTLTV